MRDFFKRYISFILILFVWVASGIVNTQLSIIVISSTVILLWNKAEYFKVLLGLLVILFLSDNLQPVLSFAKDVKGVYMLLIGVLFVLTSNRFTNKSRLFVIFIPFIIYAYFALFFADANVLIAIQKTISYTILLLVVPNILIHSIKKQGKIVLKDILHLFSFILVIGIVIKYISFDFVSVIGRFTNLLGNPNGLGIFLLLIFLYFKTIFYLKPELFSRQERLFFYVLIFYNLFLCSSRTAMGGILFYVVAERLFRTSSFIAIVALVLGLFSMEYLFLYIPTIIEYLNLEEYFRLQTLEDGSGRFIAWQFAWNLIQENFFFGGGFGYDEYNMRQYYSILSRLGHQGGVHNSYLSLWFDFGLVGIIIFMRSFILTFFKAHKKYIISLPLMFTIMFSITYESWIVASLNPFTIFLILIMTTLLYYSNDEFSDNLTQTP